MVSANLGNAFYSVLLAYVLPSILILVAIFLFTWWKNDELSAAIFALGITALYFFILYLLRNKIGKKIKFTVESISNY